MKSEKGQIFLKFMFRAMVRSLKRIPGGEWGIELCEAWSEASAEVHAEQEKVSHKEGLARLEEAQGFSPSEAQILSKEVMVEMRKQGEVISEAKEQLITELASVTPALIRERTQATLRQARNRGSAFLHTTLPIAEGGKAGQAFYHSLFPRRRPRLQVGDAVPHRVPPWHVVQLLGMGGFGEVWEVRNPHLPDHFAVKFCQDEISAKILKREAQALITLYRRLPQHPHIARLLELQLDQEPYWLAFEYVNGGTLESLLRTGPLSWAESLKLFRALVEAMSAVHRVGIVHRDLKPANILLTEQNEVKITDFGIGKVLAEQEAVQQQTHTRFTSMGYGTAGYMSPEQAAGEPAHPADDTFALGVLLWQMLSGSLRSPPANLYRKIDQLPVPHSIQQLILTCVTDSRTERPQNAMALLAVLEGLVDKPQGKVPEFSPIIRSAETTFRDQLKDGSEGPEMVVIPVGKFKMGDDHGDDDEKPTHWVTIDYTLAVGKYPVTVGEFRKFVDATHYQTEAEKEGGAFIWTGEDWVIKSDAHWKKPYFDQTDRDPVVCISWNDAQSYCRWLNKQTGKSYRLPSEAEWEYACRAGTTTQYSFGDDEKELKNYAWYSDNAESQTYPVGEKGPNPWGLYDMHGNVWEWCEDVWHDNYDGAPTDGSAWVTDGEQEKRMLRGGSWGIDTLYCRSANRVWYDCWYNAYGFRLFVPMSS